MISQEFQIPSAILKLLALIQADRTSVVSLSQLFTIHRVQLGDEILSYYPPALSESDDAPRQNGSDLNLICQGRVRLLCFDQERQRDVAALVLEEGATFGADHLFCHPTLFYRAIAACPAQIARISVTKLRPWLEHSNLQAHLRQQAQQRQHSIFCKTADTLRALTSYQLQQLLPYLVEEQVAAGATLAQLTPASAGRFWLRWGQVQSQGQDPPPTVGNAWGYPDSIPTQWSAQTDLLVNKLSVERWEAAQAIAPVLSNLSIVQADTATATPSHELQTYSNEAISQPQPTPLSGKRLQPLSHRTLPSRASPVAAPLDSSGSDLAANTSQTESAPVAFPKPVNQHRLNRWFRHYPLVRQQSSSDCSVACLAMVGQYWGKRFSLNFLRNLANVGRTGASLKNLAKTAEALGFQARPVRASFSRLQNQVNPWIAHWQGDHYVVVYQVRGNRVRIADPALGGRTLSLQDFQAGWTGYALLLEPTEEFRSVKAEGKKSLGRYVSVLWPYRSVLLQIILASLLLQIFGLVTPFFTQQSRCART